MCTRLIGIASKQGEDEGVVASEGENAVVLPCSVTVRGRGHVREGARGRAGGRIRS